MVEADSRSQGKAYFLEEQIYTSALVFYFKKYTPWLDFFDKNMQWLREAGLVDKWYNDIMKTTTGTNSKSTTTSDNASQSLTLDHLQGSFLILIGGSLVGVFIFFLEKMF